MSRRFGRAIALGILALGLAAVVSQAQASSESATPLTPASPQEASVSVPPLAESPSPAPPVVSGVDVGSSFGFAPVDTADRGDCRFFAEYTDGEGYCMDAIVDNRAEAYSLGKLINGSDISSQEQEIVDLLTQVAELRASGAPASEVQALEAKLADQVESWLTLHGN